jgi:hypothetical protein
MSINLQQSPINNMAHQEKRYCRGCKCTVDASLFISNKKQYKQCNRCRGRIIDRERSDATVVCGCGREVLRTSLRDHLRTLYHEKRMIEKAPVHKVQKAADVARPPMPKPMSAAVIQQLKPAVIQQPKPVSASAPVSPPKPVSFVFRKSKVEAPVNSESLQRTKLKQVQSTPVPPAMTSAEAAVQRPVREGNVKDPRSVY